MPDDLVIVETQLEPGSQLDRTEQAISTSSLDNPMAEKVDKNQTHDNPNTEKMDKKDDTQASAEINILETPNLEYEQQQVTGEKRSNVFEGFDLSGDFEYDLPDNYKFLGLVHGESVKPELKGRTYWLVTDGVSTSLVYDLFLYQVFPSFASRCFADLLPGLSDD